VEEIGGKHAKTKGIVRSFSGKATNADPILQRVTSKLCCVRSSSLGLVITMLKRDYRTSRTLLLLLRTARNPLLSS
jgi:hypothetical protein